MLNSVEINCVKLTKGQTNGIPEIFHGDNLKQCRDLIQFHLQFFIYIGFLVRLLYEPDVVFVFPPFRISALIRLYEVWR